MGLVSEKSFGARLLHAQNILTYLQGFANYAPPKQEQSISGFGGFLDDIAEANMIESELEQHYKLAVRNRQDAFYEGETALLKLVTKVKAAVEAQFGKSSQQYEAVNNIVSRMRVSKPALYTVTEGSETTEQSVSQSQRSFGSLLGFFGELVAMLGQMAGYNPSNVALQVTTLETLLGSLNTLNTQVAQKFAQLKQQRMERAGLYDQMERRVQGIKAYVKAQYGTESEQYALVSG